MLALTKKVVQSKISKVVLFCVSLSLVSPFFNIGIQSTYAASPGDVLITEVEYDSIGAENEGEWVELYNPTGSTISLSGWTLGEAATGVEYAFTGGASIASESFLLLVNDTAVFNSEHPGIVPDIDMEKTDSPSCVSNGECIRLNNTAGDSLTLKDETGTIIDYMAWEDLDGFDLNGDAGFSVCRRNLNDTNSDSEWSNNCNPTPGTGTFVTQFPGGVPVASLLWAKVDSETYTHGDTITVLNDRSGNDRDGTNSGTPSFDTTHAINFYPTASFDGSSDGFVFPEYSFPIGDKNYTMYTVFSSPLSQDNMTLQYVGRNSGTNNSTITYIDSDGSTHDDFDNGAANLNSSPASSVLANSPTIISFNYNSQTDTKKTFINGDEISSLAGIVDHNASNTASSDRGIGFNADSSSNYFIGNIAEILAYDSELDSTSKQKIDSYLALKYGITLDQSIATDYINSSGAVLWDSTINSDYTHNIIGVGQNNLSDLDQKISHSINSDAIVTLSTSNDFVSLNTDIARTSLDDGKFIIVGNNTGTLLTQTSEIDTGLYTSRIMREWKVQNTGNVGEVFLKFDGFDENVVLLTDSDGDFSTGVTNNGALNSDGSSNITLSDGEYFTLATPVTNNSPTDITLSGSMIDENNSVGDVIGELSSVDLDSGDSHTYSFTGSGNDNARFDIIDGQLLASEIFDYETKTSYTIRVLSNDGNGGTFEKDIVITINDLDEVPPVVSLIGSGTVEILLNASFTDLGAQWTDNVDGSGSIVTASSGSVDTAVIGQYVLEYTYTDTNSNPGNTVTRTVNVVSGDTPVITLNGSGSITQEVGNTYTDLGAQFSDTEDGTGSLVGSGIVDINTVGIYSLSYDYTDQEGNVATQVTRTVNIVDTTNPVVTLNGSSSENILLNASFTDLGAQWTDNVDGSGSIVTASSGSVDTAVIGQYVLEYTYTDTNSNSGNTVTRIVNVVSGDTPVITLNGSGSITQEVGNFYFDAGAEYVDTEDGTSHIVGSGSFDAFTVGVYILTYDYTDSHGNIATQVTRTVNIVDTTNPVVVLNGSSSESVFVDSVFIDVGAQWTDNVDGSGSIVTASSGSVDTAVLGQYLLDYEYIDASGNAHSVTRIVNVVSGDTPIITINGNGTVTQEVGSGYIDLGAEYVDTEDGTGAVVASGNVDGYTVGEYILTYDFDDSQGNTAIQATRTVRIVDTTDPVVTLNGDNPSIVLLNEIYVYQGATWEDNYDGSGVIFSGTGNVDPGTVGIYTLDYTYEDASGNSHTVTRTINVVSGNIPVITLNGSEEIDHEFSHDILDFYVDAGAVFNDIEDGTGAVYGNSTIDNYNLGTYILTYDYTDYSGNPATQVTRTVNIVDTTAPVIVLNGNSSETVYVGEVFVDQGAEWTDNVDYNGYIFSASSGSVDTSVVGTYILEYTYIDSSGNSSSVTRTVHVISGDTPVISLIGNETITQELGNLFIDEGAEYSDTEDGTGSLFGSGIVDINTVGIYSLNYDYTDTSGNSATQIIRTVNIVDTSEPIDVINPVISLVGDSEITLEVNSIFIDEGAIWTDNIDGSGSILTPSSGAVDTSTVGAYVLEYTYTDTAGNSYTITRTVNIVDTTPIPIEIINPVPIVEKNTGRNGGYSKRKTGGNLRSSIEKTQGEQKTSDGEVGIIDADFQKIADEVENSQITKSFDELSDKLLSERTKEINGEIKTYSLDNDYNSCKIIDNLLDESYTDNFQTQLQDISNLKQTELIKRLEKTGVINGTTDNNFEGIRQISRVEFLKVVLRSHCIEYRNQDPSYLDFSDLDNTTWQAKVIKKSLDLGIVNGDLDVQGNKIFRANDIISTIEATKILMRMALVQKGLEPESQYTDISIEWHKNYVNQGEYLGVFSPDIDNYTFNPDDPINRNKTVEFLYKVITLYR